MLVSKTCFDLFFVVDFFSLETFWLCFQIIHSSFLEFLFWLRVWSGLLLVQYSLSTHSRAEESPVMELARTSVILRALERELPIDLSSFLCCLKPGGICHSILFSPPVSDTGSPAGLPGGNAIKGDIAQD